MNKNIKIAKEIVKLAKSLVAANKFEGQWYYDYQSNKGQFIIECPLPGTGIMDESIKLENTNEDVTEKEKEIISQWLIDSKDVGFRDIRKVIGFCKRVIETSNIEADKDYRQDMLENKQIEYDEYLKKAKQEMIEIQKKAEEVNQKNIQTKENALKDKERIINGFIKNHFTLISADDNMTLSLNSRTDGIRIILEKDPRMNQKFIDGAIKWLEDNGAKYSSSIA